MQKITALLMMTVLLLSMAACEIDNVGGSQPNTTPSTSEPTTSETEGEIVATTQPVTDVAENPYDPTTLGAFGLPEPEFTYTYLYYDAWFASETQYPYYVYSFDCDAETALAFMKTVQNAGWEGWTPETVPTMLEGDSFWYTGNYNGYHINITWDTEGEHFMFVIDYNCISSWDEEISRYVIEGFGEYGTYGPNKTDYQFAGNKAPV